MQLYIWFENFIVIFKLFVDYDVIDDVTDTHGDHKN